MTSLTQELPLLQAVAAAAPKATLSASNLAPVQVSPDAPPPPARILLVDDRPDKLLALEAVLASLGQQIVQARSGKDALRLLLKEDFAVILLDVSMPGMDGFETAALIRQRPRTEHTPIIFITSINQSENHISRGYALGAVDYLLTPIVPEILRSKVAVLVDLHRHTETIRRQGQLVEDLNLKLQQRVTDLTTANAELEAFNYSIAHDLRAPLRAMGGFATALVEDEAGGMTALGREYLARIHNGAQQMDRLLLDLLSYSRIGRTDMSFVPVDLPPILHEILAVFEPVISQQRTKIEVASLFHPIYAHPPTLRQIVSNLVENALKFIALDRAPLLRIFSTPNQGFTRLWVEDNGIGIGPQHHQKIFGLFTRLHEVRTYPGTGVGLALVKKGAERMGGRAGVESQPGNGSRFWVDLPATQASNNGQSVLIVSQSLS